MHFDSLRELVFQVSKANPRVHRYMSSTMNLSFEPIILAVCSFRLNDESGPYGGSRHNDDREMGKLNSVYHMYQAVQLQESLHHVPALQ